MFPASSQPSHSFATVKTQKFSSIKNITSENLNLGLIIDLRKTYINFKGCCELFKTTCKKLKYHHKYFEISKISKMERFMH